MNKNRKNLLRLAGIEEESIVDGPGLRLVVFTQGCTHHCRGCQNPQTHPLAGGESKSLDQILALYDENPLLDGITFSGGEPFLQAEALACLGAEVHNRQGTVVTYTGYTFEALIKRIREHKAPDWEHLLAETDLLIEGPYIAALRDLELTYCGSSNQRILDRHARKALEEEIVSCHKR